MKNFLIRHPLLFLGFVSLNLAHPMISVAQVAEIQFVNGDPLPDAPELAQRGMQRGAWDSTGLKGLMVAVFIPLIR